MHMLIRGNNTDIIPTLYIALYIAEKKNSPFIASYI